MRVSNFESLGGTRGDVGIGKKKNNVLIRTTRCSRNTGTVFANEEKVKVGKCIGSNEKSGTDQGGDQR